MHVHTKDFTAESLHDFLTCTLYFISFVVCLSLCVFSYVPCVLNEARKEREISWS